MDLDQRSLVALDWDRVRERLGALTQTAPGAALARELTLADDLEVVHRRYAEVEALMSLAERRDHPPLTDIKDIGPWVDEVERGGILDEWVLLEIVATLAALLRLRAWTLGRPTGPLREQAERITVDEDLVTTLERSFDTDGQLSGEFWPKLGAVRSRVFALKARLRDELERLAFGEALADVLQDRFITEREGRWVLPVKASYRRGVGILHGHSQTGETAYVEPTETVELQNDVRDAEAALAREVRRILADLSLRVAQDADAIRDGLAGAGRIDLAHARSELGLTWRGVVPKVGTDGVIKLPAARHPVLVLRGAAVVANDLTLDTPHPSLVLTGLNAGGKTVLLKTIGLAALLVRAGIPVPAGPGARVDLFPTILADVGDLQSVESDVSTFSGHVGVLRDVLARAAPGTLVLLDEVAVGTDQAQGAALARAVLETLLDRGARVVLTTHYPELKGIEDDRVVVGAMEQEAGRPTYRLIAGAPGASHALAIARQLGIPEEVVDRARTLLDARSRELEDQAERLRAERERLESLTRALRRDEAALRAKQVKLDEQLSRDKASRMAEFDETLRRQEEKVRGLVAALQADPSLRSATVTLAEVRAARKAEEPAPPAPEPVALAPGQKVKVASLGQVGELVSLDGDRAEVRVRGMVVKVDRATLTPTQTPKAIPRPPTPMVVAEVASTVRTRDNTCDLRGQRVEEAMADVEAFLDGLSLRGVRTAYLLHGHGTGALKVGLRGWLGRCRYVRSWRPADANEGGDAYTVIELGEAR